MANYTRVITDAGLAKLTEIANGAGALEWTEVKCGDGAIGAGDPTALTDIISELQSFDTVDVREDGLGDPFIFFVTDNEGLAAGYLRREVGVFGRATGDPADTMILYLYAPTDPDADFIPVPAGGIASIQTFRVQIAEAEGLTASVTVDHSTVYLALDRWADHLAGAGAVDQHPTATSAAPGLMSASDKYRLDYHIGRGGVEQHPAAVPGNSGFMSATDKAKLDGIQAGAEVNQNAFAAVDVQGVVLYSDSKSDVLKLRESTYVTFEADVAQDSVTIVGRNITPSSHIGTGGGAHAVASVAVNGFLSAVDKTKLDGIAAGAEVNQNAFGNVVAGGVTVAADGKQDSVEIAAGANIEVTGDAGADRVTIAGDFTSGLAGSNFRITPEGGFAVRLVNRTGAASVKGAAVNAHPDINGAVRLTPGNSEANMGFIYDAGVADGDPVWVVVAGLCDVLLKAGAVGTRGAQMAISDTDGRVKSAGVDAPGECGQFVESSAAGQLCRAVLGYSRN